MTNKSSPLYAAAKAVKEVLEKHEGLTFDEIVGLLGYIAHGFSKSKQTAIALLTVAEDFLDQQDEDFFKRKDDKP